MALYRLHDQIWIDLGGVFGDLTDDNVVRKLKIDDRGGGEGVFGVWGDDRPAMFVDVGNARVGRSKIYPED